MGSRGYESAAVDRLRHEGRGTRSRPVRLSRLGGGVQLKKATKRLLAVAAGVFLPLGGLTGTSEASTEAVAAASCPVGNLCLWTATNFKGERVLITEPRPVSDWSTLHSPACPGGLPTCVSSAYNNAVRCTADLWERRNYSGSRISLAKGSGYSYNTKSIWSNSWRC
ncbi:peptidase inhibitor family I36 protein [Streptomyces sp. NPDC002845]